MQKTKVTRSSILVVPYNEEVPGLPALVTRLSGPLLGQGFLAKSKMLPSVHDPVPHDCLRHAGYASTQDEHALTGRSCNARYACARSSLLAQLRSDCLSAVATHLHYTYAHGPARRGQPASEALSAGRLEARGAEGEQRSVRPWSGGNDPCARAGAVVQPERPRIRYSIGIRILNLAEFLGSH